MKNLDRMKIRLLCSQILILILISIQQWEEVIGARGPLTGICIQKLSKISIIKMMRVKVSVSECIGPLKTYHSRHSSLLLLSHLCWFRMRFPNNQQLIWLIGIISRFPMNRLLLCTQLKCHFLFTQTVWVW